MSQSKIQGYCNALYERMDSEATIEEGVRVWKGRLIATCKDLGIPEGSYAKVAAQLRALGCIEQVSRGYRGSAFSMFVLHFPPTDERWLNLNNSALTNAPSLDRLAAAVEDMRRQIGGINLISALENLDERLGKVETAQARLEGLLSKSDQHSS